ncbi:hypothetical protein BDN72DRAFT_833406 [Pluteus cervinus]|uniref:Uncharacterized protein n=1 Tax=Pluteus cervinus TaxID=181527 RepID=A0ACD3B9U4_9AGAR|nr:hypothetical protein BDN72DRAFT_833406 [Pluteus cervinus]
MFLARRCCRSLGRVPCSPHTRRISSGATNAQQTVETDSCGIPLRPSWSVHELLSSYAKPTLSTETLKHIHDLSALIPPAEGTEGYARLKRELEELIRLVEAVKLVDTTDVVIQGRREVEDADRKIPVDFVEKSDAYGAALLKNAARTKDGFYVVDADRKR